ncbi:hypothetical protein BDF21DRAFT_419841 [Thamnidium elegans]|uniref:BTB domain-containing protein n=1 Tax=Thamnidium elegans TaxID=101142 RepID=A0A8H7SH07_9FUNG|nr:hypothetical protein INT48_004189 [Thamnidium elegans]KAI8079292.1 hypothetical protein BDF21DRAFT_419841 [Thamnidium elegans]
MVVLTNGMATNGFARQSIADLTTDIKSTKGEVPPPLVGSSTTVIGDDLYVFGGRVASTRQMTNYLYILHLPTLTWARHIAPPDSAKAPVPRYFHSATVFKDRYIVLFGGMGNATGRRPRQQQQLLQEEKLCAMDDVSMFDIETMSWVEINVSPSIFTPQARYAHLATIWDSDKLIIMGGQDIANTHINEINVFDLTACAWVHGGPMNGPYDAYRAVAFCPSSKNDTTSYGGKPSLPFWNVNTNDKDKIDDQPSSPDAPPVCIYSNYNFSDLTRDLQSFMPMRSSRNVDFHNHASEMTGSLLPPGLRFPTGQLMGHYFVVSGTFLSSTQRGFQIWALNLTNLSWSHIDTGSTMSEGSWNRGLLSRRKYYILGHSQRDLKDDYSYRRINFDHIATVDLEAFGIYSLPPATCSTVAQELGLSMLNEPGMSDLTIWTTDRQSIPANSVVLAERWPEFAQLLHDQEAAAKAKNIRHTQIQRKQLLFPENYSVTLAFLQYIYTDHLITAQQHQPQILSRLLVLSDMYNLERLKQLTTYALHQLLTISTASMVYETATLTFQGALQIRALRIMMNAKRMLLGQHQQQHKETPPLPPAPLHQAMSHPEHQEWAASMPLSPSSNVTVPGSTSGSYYSSDEPLSPHSLPSSPPAYSNLRRLAQPGMSPSSSDQTQQRYIYFNNAKTPLSPPLVAKKQGYFDQPQYNMSSNRSVSSYH